MEQGSTALQACESVGVEVPRFCYHERLSIAGNCRMCLVEIEKTPKPVASCAMPLMEGMKIYTDTPLVKKAREAVLEFLLLNHPLDCPICDQGGECDLQDQALVFGSDRSRFYETKRTVENKNYGPLVKTIMTRCIHCTRCVRFATEIAGIEDLGCTGRGNETEIGTYIGGTLKSELSGNVIDLCPVGALTSKPHAFTSRPWEIRSTNSVDTTDGLGSNIRIDFRGMEILRVLPRFKEEINEEWISDKIRFLYDGLKRQRIGHPLFNSDNGFQKANWKEAVDQVQTSFTNLDPSKIKVSIGGDTNLETLTVTKDLLNKLGVSNYSYQNINNYDNFDERSNYIFNGGLQDLDNVDICLIVNTNPRHDASLLNARLRKRYLKGNLQIGVVGSFNNFTFPFNHIGSSLSSLEKITEGKHNFSELLSNAKNPRVIICTDSLNQKQLDFLATQRSILESNLKSINVSVLSTEANRVGAFDLGIGTYLGTNSKFNYIIDTDTSSLFDKKVSKNNVWSRILSSNTPNTVYQGHHGDLCASSQVVFLLPGATFTEERSLYINTEGRCQSAKRVYKPALSIRENWKIVKVIGGNLLNYFNYKAVANRINKLVPAALSIGETLYPTKTSTILKGKTPSNNYNTQYKPLVTKLDNYYTTNTVTRASETMAECSSVFVNKTNFSE